MYYHRSWNVNVPKRISCGPLIAMACAWRFRPTGSTGRRGRVIRYFPDWLGDVEILTYDSIDDKYVLYGRYGARPGGPIVMPSKPDGVWSTRRRIYRTESKRSAQLARAGTVVRSRLARQSRRSPVRIRAPWRTDEMHLGLLNVFHLVQRTLWICTCTRAVTVGVLEPDAGARAVRTARR